MQPRIMEKNKKAGVCYAMTDEGVELPIIDVTHPAFVLRPTNSELDGLLQKHLKDLKSQERMPAFVRRWMVRFVQEHSILLRGVEDSVGTFLTSMHTYMLKLGADNLNDAYVSRIDHRVAASLRALSVRLPLQYIDHLE